MLYVEGVWLMIGSNEIWGMNLVSGFPCVVHFRIPLPFDEILKCSGPAGAPVVDDTLHLVFLLPFQKVRWKPRVIRPMFWTLVIGG
jgi:hypothetical protein